MKSESIIPKDEKHWLELRANVLTSTEIPALFGLSPYVSEFELFHRKKKKQVVEIEPNERITWGRRLEAPIAEGIAELKGWKIRAKKEFMQIPELRMGASFDYELVDEKAILEIKNVDSLQFDKTWTDEGEGMVAPNHIELQLQLQLFVSGYPKGYIGALVGGNRLEILERTPNEFVLSKIKEKVKLFWDSIDADIAPVPDFQRDAEFIFQLYSASDPSLITSADDEIVRLATEYRDLGSEINERISKREGTKAKLLTKIDKAEKCYHELFTISAGQIKATVVAEHTRPGRRDFRINWKKIRPN